MRYARDNNDSKEVAFVFRNGLMDKKVFSGTDDSLDFENGLDGMGSDLFVMHNHPRNSSYSAYDIAEFTSTDAIKGLSIVKNNGLVEILSKTEKYDKKKVVILRERYKKKYVLNGTDTQYEKLINKLLADLATKGMIIWMK